MTQPVTEQQDALVSLWTDLRAQRERIAKISEPTPKKALTELSDTGLSVTEDLVAYFLQFRQYVSESFEDIDVRLSELEAGSDAAVLTDEEAAMIMQLATTCEAFVVLVKETSTSISPDARKRIDEALALVGQVRGWVDERMSEEDQDEDDDAGEETAVGEA
jgi:hypothetical protein